MKFDVYASYTEQVDDSTENTVRKTTRNLSLEDAKKAVNDFFDSFPEKATGMYLEVSKSYNDQIDAALAKY
jgi:hypothetical protein